MLASHLKNISLTLSEAQQQQLLQHIDLLNDWNKHINITSIAKDEMLDKHIIDSLSIAPFFSSYQKVADIGTGGGFPGVPLAIMYPQNQYTLLDSNNKKCGFLRYAINDLKLSNVEVVHSRIEQLSVQEGFDAIVCRALSAPQKVYNLCIHLVKKGGKIFVMASNSEQYDWQHGENAKAPKDEWEVHVLPTVSHIGERCLLEYST